MSDSITVEVVDENLTGEEFYKGREEQILSNVINVREKIVESMTDGGNHIPRNARDLEVLNSVLSGLEGTVTKKVDTRIKIKDSNNESAKVEMVAEILRRSRKKQVNIPHRQSDELEDTFVPMDIVPGETGMGSADLQIEDFVPERNTD